MTDGRVARPASEVARRRQVEGAALLAFGLTGLVLVVLGLGALANLRPAEDAPSPSSDPSRADPATELRLTLAASEAALRDAATSSRSAGAGLVEAADAAGAAGTLMSDLAATMRGLGEALRITILGAQPFGALAPAFDIVADRADVLATDLEAVRATVRVGADDLEALAGRLSELGERVGSLRGSVDRAMLGGLEGLESLRLFGTALLAWLAVPALASVLLGVRRVRIRRPIAPGDRSRKG